MHGIRTTLVLDTKRLSLDTLATLNYRVKEKIYLSCNTLEKQFSEHKTLEEAKIKLNGRFDFVLASFSSDENYKNVHEHLTKNFKNGKRRFRVVVAEDFTNITIIEDHGSETEVIKVTDHFMELRVYSKRCARILQRKLRHRLYPCTKYRIEIAPNLLPRGDLWFRCGHAEIVRYILRLVNGSVKEKCWSYMYNDMKKHLYLFNGPQCMIFNNWLSMKKSTLDDCVKAIELFY